MRRKLSLRTVFLLCGAAAGILYVLYAILVVRITSLWTARGLLLLFPLLFLLLLFGTLAAVRNSICGFAGVLTGNMDAMLEGREITFSCLYEETLLAKVQVKLNRLYEAMQRQAEHSKKEKTQMQELVSDISHQLKTPLANIKLYTELLETRASTPEQERQFVHAIAFQVNKLDFLMQVMFKMSRLESGILQVVPKPARIYATIAQALGGILPNAEKKKISVSIHCPELLTVPHDEKWTAEALFNLLDNAVKYTPCGGEIIVTAARQQMYTRIDVADTGKGIAEHKQATVFRRFYREPEVHEVEGVGLGLPLAREIITRQGGYLALKSAPGQGAVFSVYLPN